MIKITKNLKTNEKEIYEKKLTKNLKIVTKDRMIGTITEGNSIKNNWSMIVKIV